MENALGFLTADDRRLLLEQAQRHVYSRNEPILSPRDDRVALFLIRSGAARVERADLEPGVTLGRLGPGAVFGETAFVDQTSSTATVIADEESVEVDIVDWGSIEPLFGSAPALAARFYQSVANTLAHRVRELATLAPSLPWTEMPQLDRTRAPRASQATRVSIPADLQRAVETFKTRLLEVDRAILGGKLDPAQAQARVSEACTEFSGSLQAHTTGSPEAAAAIGAYAFRETFPFFMQSTIFDRCFTKPSGFAGDYYTIELFYEDRADGAGRLGPLIDRWAREIPASRAVKNRRRLLTTAIRDVATRFADTDPILVTSVASGPARELLDLLAEPGAPPVRATCIDFDGEALRYAAEAARQLGVADQLVLARDNVLRLAQGSGNLTLAPQHMIYSVGLFDYLNDADAVLLMSWIHDHLLPGGTVVIGNFDVANPDRALMDHIAEWRLNHRTARDMQQLFARSRFGATPVTVVLEEAKVNLFAFCTKGAVAARPSRQSGALALAAV